MKALKGSAHFWAYQTHHRSIDFLFFTWNEMKASHSSLFKCSRSVFTSVAIPADPFACKHFTSSSSYWWSCVCPAYCTRLWSRFLPPDRLTRQSAKQPIPSGLPAPLLEFWCSPLLPTHRAVCPSMIYHRFIVYGLRLLGTSGQLLLTNFQQQKGPQCAEGKQGSGDASCHSATDSSHVSWPLRGALSFAGAKVIRTHGPLYSSSICPS
jgi:hypothetical protein